MKTYLVPFQEAEAELVEKRSRFIGHIWRVESEEEARARIEETRKRHYDARHHCWCCLLREGSVLRYSDDGEPQGTAGQPMLNVFQREEVWTVCCVVTRYFGGILLGAGGLTRAYGAAAKAALNAAGLSRMRLWATLAVPCTYPLYERMLLLIADAGGIVEESDFGADILLTVTLQWTGNLSKFWKEQASLVRPVLLQAYPFKVLFCNFFCLIIKVVVFISN